MKKMLFVLIFVSSFLVFPSAALAQTGDSVNLYIQILDQKAAKESVTSVSLQSYATGEITEQILDSAQQVSFKDFPLQQFSMVMQNNSEQNAPRLNISLYRGAKTQILFADQNAAELCVATGAKQLSMALILDGSGHLKLYAVSEKTTKAFTSLPASKSESNTSRVGLKFYFQDTWGTALSGLALKMDAGDLCPSNLDGEIYMDSVSAGVHKLIASSKSGAKLAESYITLSRKNETLLTGSNETNPMIAVNSTQQIAYVLADVQNNLIKIRQVSASPLSPGTRPELSVVSLQGCLVDSAQKPVPQIKLSMGDYTSTTDASGAFEVDKLPLDQYQVVAKDASGKKIASFALLMQKDFETGIKEVALNSASVSIGPSASNLFLTLQLTDDHALMLRAASDKQLSMPAPSPAATPVIQAAQTGTTAAPGDSLLAVYVYLLAAILVLIVLVLVVLVYLRRAGKPKH